MCRLSRPSAPMRLRWRNVSPPLSWVILAATAEPNSPSAPRNIAAHAATAPRHRSRQLTQVRHVPRVRYDPKDGAGRQPYPSRPSGDGSRGGARVLPPEARSSNPPGARRRHRVQLGGDTRLSVSKSTIGTADSQTQVAWSVTDLEVTLASLRAKGIKIEDYDLPGLKTEDGIADVGFGRMAWIVDPGGNCLGIVQER